MSRIQNWPRALDQALAEAADLEFEWGTVDCVQWTAEIIEVLTGTNPILEHRGTYDSEFAAKRILAQFGGSLTAGWTAILGDPIPPLTAQRGDLCVVVDEMDQQCCGVVDMTGERVACLSLDGLEYLPLTAAVVAWRI